MPETNHCMQHGVGRIGSKGELWKAMNQDAVGMARGYWSPKGPEAYEQAEQVAKTVYGTLYDFRTNFALSTRTIGFCIPYLVVRTKG